MNVIDTTKRTGAALAIGFVLVAVLATAAQAGNSSASSAQASNALQLRSDALNRVYHLGDYATSASSPATANRALEVRGDALNARYHLGRYAVISPAGGFDWADAGIGAASMFGLIATAGGLFLVSRRHRAIGDRSLSQAS